MGSGPSGEEELIARHFRPLASHPGALGLTDDAAFLQPPEGADLVLTKDAIVAGTHFFPDDPPDAVARKALRVNLSDLAAKGAVPIGFLLALALPADHADDWLTQFAAGLAADAEAFACPLLGGDTVRTSGPATVSITAIGTVPRGTMVQRKGALPGDRIVVTGTIGDAALGLALRRERGPQGGEAGEAALIARYLTPQPRLVLAGAVRRWATAAMDVSDGLVGDLERLCRASGVGAIVQLEAVPLSPQARSMIGTDADLFANALTGGDDYEILASVPEHNLAALREQAERAGIALTEIGTVTANAEVAFVDTGGAPVRFARGAFSHF